MCLSLDDNSGLWSSDGVTTLGFDPETNITMCTSNHLTSFAVLIQAREREMSYLGKIISSTFSYILLSISFIAMIVTLILFAVAGKEFLKVEMNILYLNYAIALTLGIGGFIIGIESVKDVMILCTIVGVFLHYTWLSVFSWSLCNGILIFYRSCTGSSISTEFLILAIDLS